jgi:hypothetical protein
MSFKAINNYFINFLKEHGDDDFVSLWKNSEKEFKGFFNKTIPKKTKKNKDKNAPIRNLNSYMQFCKVIREVIKVDTPGIDSKEILREMGRRWGLLNDSQKKKYVDMAEVDKKRYEEAKKNYIFSESTDDEDVPKERKKRAKKDPNAPKGAVNSYLLFCREEKDSVKEETGLEGTELKTELTLRWKMHKEANDDIFDRYQAMANEDKARFKSENDIYKGNNNEETEEEKVEVEEKPKKAVKKEENSVKKDEIQDKAKKTAAPTKGKKKVTNEDDEDDKPKKTKKKIVHDDEDDE